MDRPTVTALISNQYEAVVADLSIPEGSAALYSAAVDMALRALSVEESLIASYVVPDTQNVDYIALVDYYTLEAFLRHTPTFADIQAYTPQVAKKRSQVFAQLRDLRDDAASKVQMLGYPAVSTRPNTSYEVVRLELDYLEPDYGGF